MVGAMVGKPTVGGSFILTACRLPAMLVGLPCGLFGLLGVCLFVLLLVATVYRTLQRLKNYVYDLLSAIWVVQSAKVGVVCIIGFTSDVSGYQ